MPGAEAVYRFRIILSGAAGVGRQLFVLSVSGRRKMDQEYCIVKAYRDDRAYVIADVEDSSLFLHQVIAQESVDTERIVQAFGRKILFFVSCLENSCMSRSGS